VAGGADVTLVTYERYPALPPDDQLVAHALARRGVSVRAAVWSDPQVDWSVSPLTVLRATWDYPQRFAEFQAWLARVERATTLVNDAATVRWNAHKRYLAELAKRGVAIVPTLVVGADEAIDLVAATRARGWDDVVLKPCVGGSAYGTLRVRGAAIGEAGAEHLRALQRSGDVLVQSYLTAVETAGERAHIVIDGVWSHAVRKVPFNDATETTGEVLHEPSPEERAFVERVLATLPARLPYARVDVVPTADGLVLMELELIEPSLYFELAPGSADRLAAVVIARG
jgi:glutathione synthase/RimK-type ligase-like ATP-grasp enzyme